MYNRIDYMRISVTDRCNLRCQYCMPKNGISFYSRDDILTFEEIVRLVKIFVSIGGKKIRLTGGEPLVRKGTVNLASRLNEIEGIEDISITTNGVLLPLYVESLKKAGVKRINISLDTLRADRFKLITGNDALHQVIDGIKKIKRLDFQSIKLNMVVMKGINDDEIIDFVHFTMKEGLTLRFIEFMKVTPLWQEKFFIPIERIKDVCKNEFGLQRTEYRSLGPAEYYEWKEGIIGFIKTSHKNCSNCSRLRLTSTGELRVCLYQSRGISLRSLLREKEGDDQIRNIMEELVNIKGNISFSQWKENKTYMSSVGG